jgi:hypothetical protein
MKLIGMIVAVALASNGCSAASSALGGVLAPKPTTQITIVNAPAVTATTGVASTTAPATPANHDAKRAMLTGGLAGAAAGGIAMRGSTQSIMTGALLGAGVGTLAGYVVHRVTD